jgi:hypothetical protein
MSWSDLRVLRSRSVAGDLVVRFDVAVLDAYLEFLAVRSRPNTVAAVAYDLKVFFTVVGKAAAAGRRGRRARVRHRPVRGRPGSPWSCRTRETRRRSGARLSRFAPPCVLLDEAQRLGTRQVPAGLVPGGVALRAQYLAQFRHEAYYVGVERVRRAA